MWPRSHLWEYIFSLLWEILVLSLFWKRLGATHKIPLLWHGKNSFVERLQNILKSNNFFLSLLIMNTVVASLLIAVSPTSAGKKGCFAFGRCKITLEL